MKTIKRHRPAIWGPSFFDDFLIKDMVGDVNMPSLRDRFPVNILEDDKEYGIELVAPGFAKDAFNIMVENDELVVSSTMEEKKEDSGKNWNRKEYVARTFERRFELPEDILAEQIKAAYTDGILRIVLPKDLSAKANLKKRIEIQ